MRNLSSPDHQRRARRENSFQRHFQHRQCIAGARGSYLTSFILAVAVAGDRQDRKCCRCRCFARCRVFAASRLKFSKATASRERPHQTVNCLMFERGNAATESDLMATCQNETTLDMCQSPGTTCMSSPAMTYIHFRGLGHLIQQLTISRVASWRIRAMSSIINNRKRRPERVSLLYSAGSICPLHMNVRSQ